MDLEEHCAHCPLEQGQRCVRFCDRAASGDPTWRRHIQAVSAWLEGQPLPPRESAGPLPFAPASTPLVPLAGDLVAILTHKMGADRLAQWAAAKFGVPCGCDERQKLLNHWDAKLRRRFGLPVPDQGSETPD